MPELMSKGAQNLGFGLKRAIYCPVKGYFPMIFRLVRPECQLGDPDNH